jgi:PAS domain S-box-containing protein
MRRSRSSPAAANGNRAAVSRGRLLAIFAPILALLGATAVLVVAALTLGWHQAEMLTAAEVLAGIAGTLAIFLLYRQIGQRQAANRALQSLSARVGNIVEAAMDPIITIDERQRIVGFNAAAERVFRWPRDAVLGQPLDKLLPERFREIHRNHIDHFGTTGTTSRRMGTQMVLKALRADGGEFPIEASISQHSEEGQKLFTVILRDISERVDSETMLARGEARLRGILDSAMDAIITVDETQHVVLFNAAAEAMFGCPRDEAIGAPLAWFIPQRFRDAHVDHVRHFGETGIVSRRMGAQRIVTGLRRNGEEFPIDAAISQLAEHDTKFYTVILRDITERVRAEDALQRSKEELKELGAAAHMAREHEKSRVARELHDELGQSLTALQMDVAWCKEKIPPGEQALVRKLDRMQAMLDATVAATRRIAADLRPLMLDDLGLLPAVEWLVEDFSQRSGVSCDLEVSDPDLDLTLPDEQATAVFRGIQESLTNVTKHARASRVEVAIGQRNDILTVRVSDNGMGFSADAARKPESYGLLGLRERAALLGGEATISSAPGAGTRVEIRLPVGPRTAPS